MDLGVGSFFFSQGILSVIPILQDPSYLIAHMPSKFLVVMRKSFPVLLLGIVRVLGAKGAEYPVVISLFFRSSTDL